MHVHAYGSGALALVRDMTAATGMVIACRLHERGGTSELSRRTRPDSAMQVTGGQDMRSAGHQFLSWKFVASMWAPGSVLAIIFTFWVQPRRQGFLVALLYMLLAREDRHRDDGTLATFGGERLQVFLGRRRCDNGR